VINTHIHCAIDRTVFACLISINIYLLLQELFEEGVKLRDSRPIWSDVIIPLINDSFSGSTTAVTKQQLLKQLAVIKLLINILDRA